MYSKLFLGGIVLANAFSTATAFDPCPLLGPNFPQPASVASSPAIRNATAELKSMFDKAIATGNSSHGPLGEKTTSFSVALFTVSGNGGNQSEKDPFFWEYHYTAPSLANSSRGVKSVDATSVYRLGSMTQVFNVWTLLVSTGEQYLDRPVTDFIQELAEASKSCSASDSPLTCVDWCEVTLRELGSHMSGIARDFGFSDLANEHLPAKSLGLPAPKANLTVQCGSNTPCTRQQFFAGFLKRDPVYAPATSPILSNAAFQLLEYALQSKSFDQIFRSKILSPLGLESSSLSLTKPLEDSKAVIPGNSNSTGWDIDVGDEASSLGLYSNLRDFTTAARAMLSSTLLKPAQTRRWLKPVTLTSNLANTNGMPWEIYSEVAQKNGPIIDVYTYIGNLEGYSSYIGLTPNYNVGFVILSASNAGTPDLNAHADFVGDALVPQLEKTAATQAISNHAGSYVEASSGAKLSIATEYTGPGLEVTSMKGANGTDLKATLAILNGITAGADALSFRLFPTNLQNSSSRAFRAVYQDESAFEDSGTPTCISWMGVDGLVYNSKALDLFIFSYENGKAIGLEVPGFGLKLSRSKS